MIVEKKTIRRYEVLNVAPYPFWKFGTFRKLREDRLGLSVDKCCFNCNRKFKDDDDIYPVMIKGTHNRFFCKDCNNKALKDLSNKK